MVESVGFMYKIYYTTVMMICEHFCCNLGQHCVGGIDGCVMGLNVGKS